MRAVSIDKRELANAVLAAESAANRQSELSLASEADASADQALSGDAQTISVGYWENIASDTLFRLPAQLSFKTPIQISTGGVTLSYTLAGIASQGVTGMVRSSPTVAEKQALLQSELAKANGDIERKRLLKAETLSLPNQKSIVEYSGILPGVSAQYILNGKSLKENLILTSASAQAAYTFIFTYQGLTAETYDNGVVEFKRAGDPDGAPIYQIAPPCMYDADDHFSDAITVEYETTSTGGIYRLIPDPEWLHAAERVYPVTIDPTVQTLTTSADIIDNGVNESNPGDHYYGYDRMYVGSNLVGSNGKNCWAYIRFCKFNTIVPAGAYIDSAQLRLTYYPTASFQTAVNNQLEIHRVNSTWATNVTWSTKPAYVNNARAVFKSDKSHTADVVNIRGLVTDWCNERVSDAMLVIKPTAVDDTKHNRACYYTSDNAASLTAKRPVIEIKYFPAASLGNGCYFLRNRGTNRYIDVEGASTASGAPIQQWEFHGQTQSQFQLTKNSSGYYTIKSICSNLYVSVASNSSASGAGIYQYSSSASTGAQWKIYRKDDGAYFLVPRCAAGTRCALSVPASANANGTDLVQSTYGNDTNYRDEWYLGRVIPEVPAEIISNSDHPCIPTAITIIASYWGRHGYSGFGGLTTAQMETVGRNVSTTMNAAGSNMANAYIPNGFAIFSHTSGSATYRLTPIAYEPANWSVLMTEINAGRPLLLGFKNVEYGGGHATVCVGYEQCGSTQRVYLADGATTFAYEIKPFNTTENDQMRIVHVTQA